MSATFDVIPGKAFATLRRLTGARGVRECGESGCNALTESHRHLLAMTSRRVVCACDPCALRFHDVAGGRFKLIPRDTRPLPDFQMTDGQWEDFALPIELVFFFKSGSTEKITALY